MAKHIFVTGGVVSSLGKGLTSACVGLLLESRGAHAPGSGFTPGAARLARRSGARAHVRGRIHTAIVPTLGP